MAGALDWEVIEGRREGEVRAGLAEKIRKSRRRNGESASLEPVKESEAELLEQARLKSGIKEWDGVQGDLVLGRHTWKEYIRGLHEGWLGPLDPPSLPETATETPLEPSVVEPIEASTPESPAVSNKTLEEPATPPPPPAPPPKPPKPSSPPPPHISPPSYPTSPLSVSTPESLPPSVLLPFPHLLGFLNTPTRVYRFLTRRHLADDTGASVAALVLAINSRPYRSTAAFASAADPDSAISAIADEEMLIAEGKRSWEQEEMLLQEEKEWHKSAWKEDEPGQERERVWKEKMILDARIGERMSLFELAEGERDRAIREEKRRETEKASWGWVREVKDWIGWRDKEETKGWEMGLVSQDGD